MMPQPCPRQDASLDPGKITRIAPATIYSKSNPELIHRIPESLRASLILTCWDWRASADNRRLLSHPPPAIPASTRPQAIAWIPKACQNGSLLKNKNKPAVTLIKLQKSRRRIILFCNFQIVAVTMSCQGLNQKIAHFNLEKYQIFHPALIISRFAHQFPCLK